MKILFPLLITIFLLTISCKKETNTGAFNQAYQHALVVLESNPDSVRKWFEQQLKRYDPHTPAELYLKFDFERQYWLTKHGHAEKALLAADSCILTALSIQTANRQLLLAKAYLNKGNLLFDQNRYADAYSAYYQAESFAGKLKDKCQHTSLIYDLYAQIANINFGEGRYRESLKWNNKAIQEMSGCSIDFDQQYKIQGALDNMGICCLFMDEPAQSLVYFDKALNYIQQMVPRNSSDKHNLMLAKGIIWGNMGGALLASGSYSKAIEVFRKSIRINSLPGFAAEDALITQVKLGEAYLKTNRLDSAVLIVKSVKKKRHTFSVTENQLQFQLLEAQVLSQSGFYKASDSILRAYISTSARLRRQRAMLRNTDLISQFESIDKQYKLDSLQRSNNDQQMLLLILGLTGICAGIIAIIFYRQKVKINHYVEEIKSYVGKQEILMAAYEKSSLENDRITKIVAHDLRNPLGAITTLIQLTLDQPDLNDEVRENLTLVDWSIEKLTTITSDLLIQTKVAPDEHYQKQVLNLAKLLQDNLGLLHYLAAKKHQRLHLEADTGLLASVVAAKIWRVVNNLVTNAIKFSFDGADIYIKCYPRGNYACIQVQDFGIGIPVSLQRSLFELSAGIQRSGTAGEETHGLGLLISKEIIEQHGGAIWVESKEGTGTSFFFTLPLWKENVQS